MSTEESSRNIFLPRDRLFEKRGVLDPDGENENPLTKTKYVNLYEDDTNVGSYIDQAAKWGSTPVYDRREEILNAIYDNQIILLISGTGSGKTVMMPKFVLHVLNYEGVIAITNPKRLPAEENAKRSAQNLDVELGSAVGIKYRDSKREWMSDETKLIYCTDGILLAQMKSDPLLSQYDSIIIDEAHERGLNIDLLLMLLKDVIRKRPEFKVVIMSATINDQIFVDYYTKDPKDKDIKFIKVDGGQKENKPIEEIFAEDFQFDLVASPSLPLIQINNIDNTVHSKVYINTAVTMALEILMRTREDERPGDILIFVGGDRDTQDGVQQLKWEVERVRGDASSPHYQHEVYLFCQALTSGVKKMNTEEFMDMITQKEKYMESGEFNRRVIFATNVAESSITIDGIDHVIDSGIEHSSQYHPETNLHALDRKMISKASHRQRKGRTGRTAPGNCYNMFTKQQYEKHFPDYSLSKIYMSDISEFVLRFMASDNVEYAPRPFTYDNVDEERSLAAYFNNLIERPYEASVEACLQQLELCNALTVEEKKARLNEKGIAMNKMNAEPGLSAMLISGYNVGRLKDITAIFALLSSSELKVDNYIVSLKRELYRMGIKDHKSKEAQKFERNYNNTLRAFTTNENYGDIISLYLIYKEFSKRKKEHADNKADQEYEEKIKSVEIENELKDEQTGGWIGGGLFPRTDLEYLSVNKDNDDDDMINDKTLSDVLEMNIENVEEEDKKEVNVPNPVKHWCIDNFLNYNSLQKAWMEAKRVKKRFERMILRGHDKDKPLFEESPPSQLKGTDDLLFAMAESNMKNYIKHTGDTTYVACGSIEQVTARLDDNRRGFSTFMDTALFGKKNYPKNGICFKLFRIFGNTKMLTFNGISDVVASVLRERPRFKAIMDAPVKSSFFGSNKEQKSRRKGRRFRKRTKKNWYSSLPKAGRQSKSKRRTYKKKKKKAVRTQRKRR